jgi:GNAT superfamily N-acetyltransferase
MLGDVGVRPVQLPEDEDFLRSVYVAARWPDLSLLGLCENETKALLRWQFDAQVSHVDAFFPHATHSVVLLGAEAIGQLIVDRSTDEIRVVEIALLPAFRHLGIGTVLVRSLFEEADAKHLPVRCHVVQDDDARGFWEHVGFLEQGLDGVHVAMERKCEM